MKMVERMARAMAEAHGDDYDTLEENRFTKSPGRSDYHKFALAALKAMREPSDGQRHEFFKLKRNVAPLRGSVMNDADWERAIDAAIKEAESE